MSNVERTKDSLLAPFKLSSEQVQRANELADVMSARHFNYRDSARLIVGLHDTLNRIREELEQERGVYDICTVERATIRKERDRLAEQLQVYRENLEKIAYPERGVRPQDKEPFLKGFVPLDRRVAIEALKQADALVSDSAELRAVGEWVKAGTAREPAHPSNSLVANLRQHAQAWGVTADTPDVEVCNETAMARECARAADFIEQRLSHEPNVSLKDAYAKWRESHAGWCLSGPPEFGECNCSGTTKCAKHGPHALGECPQCDKLSEARSIVATALIPPTPGERDVP